MNRGSDMPRLVNFSDSDMSTDTDSDEDGKPTKTYITPSGFPKQPSEPSLSDHSDDIQVTGEIVGTTDYKNESKEKESESKHKDESGQKFGETSGQTKSNRLVKHNEGRTSRERRSGSRSRRSRSYERRSRSRSGRSDSRDKRSSSRGRRSGSRGRRSSSRGRRSSSRGRRSSSRGRRSDSRDRSRSRGRKSGSRGRSESRSRRSRTRSRSRSKSRDRRRRSHSNSRSRYRRSRSRSKGKYRSGSRRRKDRRHGSPRRSRRNSPPRAHRTLDTLEKLGIELRPAATEEAQPAIPPYYNRLSVNPNKYAQQIAKRKLLWGSKSSEEGTAKASNWQGATFSQDQDGKMTAKFKRLMGIKEDGTSAATPEENKGQDLIKRQQELFSSMEIQYEAARQATHTQRGVGLGFSSHPHHYPS